PIIGGVLQNIPKPVLGGATLVMFGTVAAAGVKILATEHLDRRKMLIMAVSFGMGLGVIMTPNLLAEMPKLVQSIFGSAITTGGLAAIIMSALLPEEKTTAAAQATMTTATEKTAGTVS
ncbi:solute carrier family 23 protein, partial [Wenyingzhuangia sp. 1_MG-2023]|nr:solute carrier family 23 protein [Wenyingzhuangia sp. 1_MG-2023]